MAEFTAATIFLTILVNTYTQYTGLYYFASHTYNLLYFATPTYTLLYIDARLQSVANSGKSPMTRSRATGDIIKSKDPRNALRRHPAVARGSASD